MSENNCCKLLLKNLFIDCDGVVYACCHKYHNTILGNIYNNSIEEIWNSEAMKKLRQKELPCAPDCDIEQFYGDFSKEWNYPEYLEIGYTNYCTLNCIMCRDFKSPVSQFDNSFLFEKIDFDRVKFINLLGGEILAVPSAKDFIETLNNKFGKKIHLVTNGVFLDESWAKILLKATTGVQVSANAASKKVHEAINRGSDFKRVLANIKKFIQLRGDQKSPSIKYRYTIVAENVHEIADAIKLACKLKCDGITFGHDEMTVPKYLKENARLREKCAKKIRRTVEKFSPEIEIDTTHLRLLDLI